MKIELKYKWRIKMVKLAFKLNLKNYFSKNKKISLNGGIL